MSGRRRWKPAVIVLDSDGEEVTEDAKEAAPKRRRQVGLGWEALCCLVE